MATAMKGRPRPQRAGRSLVGLRGCVRVPAQTGLAPLLRVPVARPQTPQMQTAHAARKLGGGGSGHGVHVERGSRGREAQDAERGSV